MHTLDALGVGPQEPVATLAWNGYRHLECYFAVPCTGRVLHTLNPRLPAADLEFIIRDAGDQVILVDESLLPVLERVQAALGSVRHIVVLADHLPATELQRVSVYEELIGA
jgi:fatty-acyl-CoA synthase